jgi:S1-C subfamily serine protease
VPPCPARQRQLSASPSATTPPKAGDKVYAVTTNSAGETEVIDVRVRSLVPVESGQALELTIGVTAAESGGPILDTRGRVIGMMSAQPAFAGKNIAVPATWIQQIRAAPK